MRLLFTLFLSLGIYQINGQHVLIQGKVTDDYGNPISYASIFGKNTRAGVTTDAKGRYLIVLDKALDDTIVCSHVSYIEKKENIGKNKTINFLLGREKPEAFRFRIPISDTSNLSETNPTQKPIQGFFTRVEVPSYFPGGLAGFTREFKKKLSVSDSGKVNLFQGEIKVQFKVNITKEIYQVNIFMQFFKRIFLYAKMQIIFYCSVAKFSQ